MLRLPHLLCFFAFWCCIGGCSVTSKVAVFPKQLFKSSRLSVIQVAPNSFEHISNKQTNDFGLVPCNGLVVRSGNDVVVFDTPTNDSSSTELIQWIQHVLNCRIVAVVPTHFHDDCLGGLKAFHSASIPSYANARTIELAKLNHYEVPQYGFRDSLRIDVGNENVQLLFPGEGHTKDNVVGYFAPDRILFGGCLLKANKAGKGYLGDANVSAWSETVERVKQSFPAARTVIPGHGDYGGRRLLDYTIALFR